LNSSSHPLDSHDLEGWLDGLVPYALNRGDIAGGVVAVVKDGNILLQKGFGYADVGRQIPMDPERTMVRAGSTSKLFTWTAVMQLVEQGKVRRYPPIGGIRSQASERHHTPRTA
jgi:CubicO group peptidase (beta-lactamase class C family)